MNIIRINWNSLSKTCCLILLILIACKFCLDYLLKPGLSSLRYDRERREFILDVILIDTNENVTSFEKQQEETLRLRAAKFPFERIRLEHWVGSLAHVLDLGLNTIEIAITWSAHERAEKRFDFTHRSNDLDEFLKLANQLGLFVLIRLDPYIECADSDLGGLPSWLLGDDFLLELSLNDEQFTFAFERYLYELLPILVKHQLSNGGPIIGFVTSFYPSDKNPNRRSNKNSIRSFYDENYIEFLDRMFYRFSIVEIRLKSFSVCELDRIIDPVAYQSYCDPNFHVYYPLYEKTSIQPIESSTCFDDVSKYWHVSGLIKDDEFSYNEFIEKLNEDILKYKFDLYSLWKSNKSFVIDKFFYVADTEMSKGAHWNKTTLFPLSNNEFGVDYKYMVNGETGRTTKKYALAASLLKNNNNETIEESTRIEINTNQTKLTRVERDRMEKIRLSHVLHYNDIVSNMFADLEPKSNDFGLSIEQLNMNYKLDMSNKGYILYRKKVNLKPGDKIIVRPSLIRDYAFFICDSSRIIYAHTDSSESVNNRNDVKTIVLRTNCSQIEVLVENMGRVSDLNRLDELKTQRKGILSPEAVIFPDIPASATVATNWRVNFLDFTSPHILARFSFSSAYAPLQQCNPATVVNLPALLYGRFVASKKHVDTVTGIYLLLENFSMGLVLVNGYTVGKFWSSIGPLMTLFVPSQFIFDGFNEIILFDLHGHICEPVIFVSGYHVLKDYKIVI